MGAGDDAEEGQAMGKKRKRKGKKQAEEARKQCRNDEVTVFERAASESGSSLSVESSQPQLEEQLQRESPAIPATNSSENGPPAEEVGGAFKYEYDETLLAIIGVLDEIKHQSNVAGWIRAGGLWGPAGRVSAVVPSTVVPSSSTTADASTSAPPTTGNNTSASLATAEDTHGAGNNTAPVPILNGADADHMWFEHASSFKYWAQKGREAVDALGIEVVHGIIGY